MRKLLFIIGLLGVCAFFSCKKAKGPANGKSVQQNNNRDSLVNINALVNGVTWNTDSAFGYSVKYSGNDSSISNLMISAINNNASPITTMTFNIANFTGPKTYTISPPTVTAAYYVGNSRHWATHGQIVVMSDTAYALIGQFNFIADSLDISNGYFNVALP